MRIVLCGRAASGKDYMRRLMVSRGFKYQISYTSRPPRPGEVDGIDYFFLEKDRFVELASQGFFYECVDFNGWMYGTSNDQWTEGGLFIMTPSGISKITPADRLQTLIIFLDMPEELRRVRLRDRADTNDLADRRMESDRITFNGFKDYDVHIKDVF